MSSKDIDEKHAMHSNKENIEIIIANYEFVFDWVGCYKCHKTNLSCDGSYIDSSYSTS